MFINLINVDVMKQSWGMDSWRMGISYTIHKAIVKWQPSLIRIIWRRTPTKMMMNLIKTKLIIICITYTIQIWTKLPLTYHSFQITKNSWTNNNQIMFRNKSRSLTLKWTLKIGCIYKTTTLSTRDRMTEMINAWDILNTRGRSLT